MDKILIILRQWIEALLARDCVETDPLAAMSPRELADLPVVHPERDECLCRGAGDRHYWRIGGSPRLVLR